MASVLLVGCGKSGDGDEKVTNENVTNETTALQDTVDYSNATDEEKKELVASIADEINGTVTINNYDDYKTMTGTQYFKLRFDTLEHQDLYDEVNKAFGLTEEQIMEDYETFWTILKENYPFYGVLEREGYDLDQMYADYKKILQAYPTAVTLYNVLEYVPFSTFNTGHLSMIAAPQYEELKSVYAGYSPWNEMYEEDSVVNNLDNWNKFFDYDEAHFFDMFDVPDESEDLIKAGRKWEEDNNIYLPELTGEVEENSDYPSNDNVKTNIIEDGKVAYISIGDFSDWNSDKDVIDEFMSKITDCTDIIFDIRYNGGGDDRYWFNLVSYLTEENLTYSKYGLTNVTDLNTPFIEAGIGMDNVKPISELPDNLNVEQSDLDNATHFVEETVDVTGTTEYCGFKGNVWLLTSPYVYSASEDFAMFCKENKFATLIGTNTGGDGCCMDPINCSLPNSGIMFRFSTFLTLNADGSNNEENGTTPDILLKDGDNVIDAVLEQIKSSAN